MAHRNWTGRYMKLRASFRNVNIPMYNNDSGSGEQKQDLLGDPQPTQNTSNIHIQLPPVWVDLLNDIDDAIENINTQSKKSVFFLCFYSFCLSLRQTFESGKKQGFCHLVLHCAHTQSKVRKKNNNE